MAVDPEKESVIFYTYPLAFNPPKAKLALEERGIQYTEKKIDILGGESLQPWYVRLNPAGTVPTLVVGEEVITESVDIMKWADEQESIPLGGDFLNRGFIEEWISKVNSWDGHLYSAAFSKGAVGIVIKASEKHKIKVAEAEVQRNADLAEFYRRKAESIKKTMDEPRDQEKVDVNKAQLVELLDEAESRLESNKFLGGEEYSMADAIFTPVLQKITTVKQEKELLDPRVNLKKYGVELKKRLSYKATFGPQEKFLQTLKIALPSIWAIFSAKVTRKY